MPAHSPLPCVARALTLGLALVALASTGCGEHKASRLAAPEPAPAEDAATSGTAATLPSADPSLFGVSHMPLAVGNRWEYHGRSRVETIVEGEPPLASTDEYDSHREISGFTEFLGYEYFIVMEYDPSVGPPAFATDFYRQTSNGLFRRTPIPIGTPSASRRGPGEEFVKRFESSVRAATVNSPHREAIAASTERLASLLRSDSWGLPGLPFFPGHPGWPRFDHETGFRSTEALPTETALLAYPLVRGARWRVDPAEEAVGRVVRGAERVRVPAGEFNAWVIDLAAPFLPPDSFDRTWYARDGLVRQVQRFELFVRDHRGLPIGRQIFTQEIVLTAMRRVPPSM